jgi:ABC-type branched-subunit amino acid transport system substrate-binding protein
VSLRTRALTVLTVVVLLGAAACGQKSGVAGTGVQADGGGGSGGGGGGGTDTTGGGGDTGGGTHEPGPDDKAGITDDEIVIGVHAPVTGASPIPQNSFDVGKDIYWQFLAQSDPEALGGRKVRVVFRDDEFNPRRAVQVCREMVENENAFVLVGGGGADQITACAKYAADNGVPYFSAGVNEEGLTDVDTYYALSLTYAQQAPLIAKRLADDGVEKVGILVQDTPTFADGHDAFTEAAEDAGLDIVSDETISKSAGEAEALASIQKLKDGDAEAVFLITSPVIYLALANAARNQDFEPRFIGPGITSGLNQVLSFGCPAVGNGEFFSPFPELDVIGQLDPDYIPSYEEFGGGTAPDDIGIALWGLNKGIRASFDLAGDDLGRASLMNAIESGEAIVTGVYPDVSYTPEDHFGGTGAHLLKADCDAKQYTTEEQFVEAQGGE